MDGQSQADSTFAAELTAMINKYEFDATQGIEHFEEHPTRQAVMFLPDLFRGAYMTNVWNS